MKKPLLLSLCLTFFILCNSFTIQAAAPIAQYSYYVEYVGFGSEIYFLNESTDAISYLWDFGDGATSTDISPVHAYPEPGIFIICLTATNDINSDYYCDTINTYYPPSADFSFSGGPTVTFTDLTVNFPSTWDWFFGDGDISNLQNPEHTFLENGDYNVCLSAGNPGGTSYVCKTVSIASYPTTEAAFSYSGDAEVSFVDLSSNAPFEWEWNFGDGDISSSQNPIHNYLDNGTFNVCLTATNAGGTDTYCEEISIIHAYAAPEANFSYLVIGLDAAFVDETLNEPFAWDWNFGDGTSSSEQNPVHSFALTGNYDVCLTATNIGGTNLICKNLFLETGIFENGINAFTLFPNPTKTTLNIQFEHFLESGVCSIYDVSGKKVMEKTVQNSNQIQISTEKLVSGIYQINLITQNGIYDIGKFIKL